MDESKKNANPQVCSVAVRIPSAMSMDALDARWVAARLVEVDPASIAVDTEQPGAVGVGRRQCSWQAAVGTLVIVLMLLATSIICLLCLRRIGSWDQLSDEQRSLTRFVVWCYYAATVGVIARWLTMAATGLATTTYSLAEYLRRWLADAVSSALIVTMTLMVLRSVSVQMGTVTNDAPSQVALRAVWGSWHMQKQLDALLHNASWLGHRLREATKSIRVTEIYGVDAQFEDVLMPLALEAIAELQVARDRGNPITMLLVHYREAFQDRLALNILCCNYGALPYELRDLTERIVLSLKTAGWPSDKVAEQEIRQFHALAIKDQCCRQGIEKRTARFITHHVQLHLGDIVENLKEMSRQVQIVPFLDAIAREYQLRTAQAKVNPRKLDTFQAILSSKSRLRTCSMHHCSSNSAGAR